MDKRKLAGYGLLLAQSCQIIDGMIAMWSPHAHPSDKEAGWERFKSGVIWLGGGVILAGFGENSVDNQIEKISNKLGAFLESERTPLSEEWQQKARQHNQRKWNQKLGDFIRNYPIEVSNGYTSLATIGMVSSGKIRRNGGEGISGTANIVQGVTMLAGIMTSLIPEYTQQQLDDKGKDNKLIRSIHQHPLRYAVGFFLVSDVMQGTTAYGEFKRAQSMPESDKFRPYVY